MTQASSPSSAKPATLFHWNDIPAEQLNPLLTRQFLTGEQAMLARLVLLAGCTVPTHSHHNEQISYIVSGSLRFTLGPNAEGATQVVDVAAGGILVIPAHLPHSAIALEDTIDLDLFAPPRQDWIERDDSYLRNDSTPR